MAIKRKINIKDVFRNYQLESILYELWNLKGALLPVQKTFTTTVAIEFSEPGPFKEEIRRIDKPALMSLVDIATSFCLNNSEKGKNLSNETRDIFYIVFNLIANQFSVSHSTYGDYARSLLLYKIIPNEIGIENSEYFLPDLFEEKKGYSIDDYLKICFIAYAGIEAHGKFSDDYFITGSEQLTRIPAFEKINNILSDISASAVHYRRERKRINSSGSFKYHPILMYPLIKQWSDVPKKSKRKRYLAPLPHLISLKAHLGIYHHFLSTYGTKFTTYFGKEIFERYVKKALESCCYGDVIIGEDKIKKDNKIPNNVKIPDFLILNKGKGIIVECKAAVLPLGVYSQGSLKDYQSTADKLLVGVHQVANFEEYAKRHGLYNVKDWLRLVVTYEPLWGMNTKIFSEILINDFKDNEEALKFKKYLDETLILSIAQLDSIQPHLIENSSIYEVLKSIKENSFDNELKSLINKTGRSFKDSYLAPFLDQITDNIE
jgi:hypothetical protein